jgi:spore germination protein KC
MKVKWTVCSILIIGIVITLTGCWNSRELRELAIVSAIGMDKAPNKDEYRVTFQVINPATISPVMGGTSNDITPVTIYMGIDRTLFGALRQTSQKVPRQLFFAHSQLLVIGEALAKSGIDEVFDIFDRSHELRLNSTVLVSRGSDAQSVLRLLSPLEKVPATGIVERSRITSEIWAQNMDVQIFDLIQSLSGVGESVISGIRIIGNPEEGGKHENLKQTKLNTYLSMSGIGLFKDGKLKRWMDGSEARGVVWVQDKLKGTTVNIDCKNKKEGIAVEIILSKTKVTVRVQDGLPIFHVQIHEEGNLSETKCPVDLSKREEIEKLNKELSKVTKNQVTKAIKAAQKQKSDIFDFGGNLKRTNPKAWKKMEKEWATLFAEGKVEVEVEAFIRRTGMRMKPYLK